MVREIPKLEDNHSDIGFFFLLIYTIALFIRPQEWVYTPDPFPVARIFLIFAFISYLIGHRPKFMGYQGWFLIAILFLIPVSGLRNYDLEEGFIEAQDFFIYSLLPFLLYAALAPSVKKQNWIFIVMALACVVMIHHGVSQKISPDGIGWSGELLSQGTRITFLGFFNDPNDLGMFFLMNIPLAYYLRSTTQNFFLRFCLYTLIISLLIGIYLTNSRGSLVGVMALLVTYVYFNYGKMKTIFMTLFMAPLAYVAMKLFRTIDADEASADGRIQAWYEGVQMFKWRPLVGIGKGGFVEEHGLTAHNSFVLVWAELGILGYILWFSTISLTIFNLIKTFSLDQEKYKGNKELINDIFLAKCLFFSFMGFLTTAFFLSRSYVVFLYVFLGISCALIVRVRKQVPELKEVENTALIFKIIGLGTLSLIGLYIIITLLL